MYAADQASAGQFFCSVDAFFYPAKAKVQGNLFWEG